MLGACATRVPAPAVAAADDLPAGWSTEADGGSATLVRWWERFGDPPLARLVALARQNNTDVRSARANLQRARALRDATAAAAGPSLTLGATVQRKEGAGVASGDSYAAELNGSWSLDVSGAIAHGVAASEADAQASLGTLAATRVAVEAEVALSYLQLRAARRRESIAAESLAAQEQTLRIAQWREQAGLGSSLEVAQSRSAVAQTRAQQPVLHAGAQQAEHALAVLTGQPPAALQPLLAADRALPVPPRDLAVAVPAQALQQRADVMAAQQQMLAAALRVAQADAARLPSAELRASLSWTALTLGSLGSGPALRSLVFGASQPLFDGGQRIAQLAAQQAAFEAAQAGYRARVLAALQDAEDALAALAGARARVDALHAAADAARQAALLAQDRYAAGLIDFQVVLETQRTLLSVQDSTAAAEAELVADHVRLYKALGGGWTPAEAAKEKDR